MMTTSPWNNPHPARGRKRTYFRKCRDNSKKQSTPRKGTKTLRDCPPELCNKETIHTPQGDENLFPLLYLYSTPETIHTPQGDENPVTYRFICKFLKKQSTPRKGTKT